MMKTNEELLKEIVSSQGWLMDALEAVRCLDLPDWYIAAGAIRNTVWNHFHGYPSNTNQNDVDVIYFDEDDLGEEQEKIIERKLRSMSPHLNWEVINQARAHNFKHGSIARKPVRSCAESIAYWSETPTCVGIRLESDGEIVISAPHGLDDLMSLVVRPIPKPYQNLNLYNQRMQEKNWEKTFPKLQIM